MRFARVLCATLFALYLTTQAGLGRATDMKDRIKRIKESIVRIFVDGQPAGSGFVVSKNGLIATCFHVVQKNEPAANNQTRITYATGIQVEFSNGTKLSATVHSSCQNQGFADALSKDFCILQVNRSDLSPLSFGKFSDVQEGDQIYLAGFPLGIGQPVFATGMLSTKWATNGYLNQGGPRDAAWLDITMNSGNSGGPVLLLTSKPESDKVIGIATFGLNPFAKPAEELISVVQGFPGNVAIMGVDFKKFGTLIGSALVATSHGVNGCISIDYIRSKLP
jgi:serine protease Do